ncbi:MAG: hypothetical protein DMG41_09515 [Acidobacteria bacterium]|nr:MAG: hypothetical protein AUH13_27525 [Acidobacteria bacterium 13_2_20CM_58_27]PYT76234.1 MAG: hypothetical protein DMG42_05825 [Acidobacteriota bacterium]PYT89173.1 MAG: hypothetical protein DMG41_09515 [Acidobacteriota bacterium]
MKRVALFLFLAGCFVPLAKAQDQFQVGAYGDYFRISQTGTNMAGLGGRVGYKMVPHVMFEGEISYDFDQGFTEHCLSTGCTVTVANSNLKVLHGLVGPKFIGGRHAIRPFLAVKGGFINFQLNPKPATFGQFTSSVQNLRSNNVSGVLYPALGAEGHLGPVGLRLEAGDEMYFAGATHHNVRLTFGPFLRF